MEGGLPDVVKLGCKVGELTFTYLGLPLGAPFKSSSIWDGVEETFRRRPSMWMRQYFLWGKTHVDLKHFIQYAYLVHVLICYLRKVRLRLEKIQRDFYREEGLQRISLIQLNGLLFAWIGGRGVWELAACHPLIRLFLVSGVGGSLLKGIFLGNKLQRESMERKKAVDVLVM